MVFSWVSHTATETSVAARTLVGSVEATSARGATPAQVAQTNPPLRTEKQPGPASELNGQAVDVATSESSASSTIRAPEGAASSNGPPALSAAAKAHVASVTPTRKRATTKPNVTRRYASRHESLGLMPGEYSRRRSADEYHVSRTRSGYYRESRHWGEYYGDGGRGPYQDW